MEPKRKGSATHSLFSLPLNLNFSHLPYHSQMLSIDGTRLGCEEVLLDLFELPTGEVYTDLIEKLIETMIPDGNYIEFNYSLFNAYEKSVNHEIQKQKSPDIDMIFKWLKKMYESAKQYDTVAFDNPSIYRYTASVFNIIETDTREWPGSKGTRMCEDMKQYLEDSKFDCIRSDIRFLNMCDQLS